MASFQLDSRTQPPAPLCLCYYESTGWSVVRGGSSDRPGLDKSEYRDPDNDDDDSALPDYCPLNDSGEGGGSGGSAHRDKRQH